MNKNRLKWPEWRAWSANSAHLPAGFCHLGPLFVHLLLSMVFKHLWGWKRRNGGAFASMPQGGLYDENGLGIFEEIANNGT